MSTIIHRVNSCKDEVHFNTSRMSPDIEFLCKWPLTWPPQVRTAEYEKSQITVSNCFKSDFKGIFVLVILELRKSFRYKVSASFRNLVRSTVRIWESFYLICVLHPCPIPIGGTNCHAPLRLRGDFTSKISNVGLERAIPKLSMWDSH